MLHLTSLAVLITTLRVGIAANDLYFNSTVLLLNGDVIPFTADASTNKYNLSPVGAPSATTFNPYQEGYYSGLFNGTSTSVNPATIPIASTGAFTIEGWIYPTSSSLQCIYSQYASAGVDPGRMNLMFNDPAGKISIGTGASGSTGLLTSTSSPPLNTWTHFALVRDGSNVAKIYINGVLDATNATFTTTIMQTPAYIGYTAASPGYGFYGYISNFRITNTAVYTGNFTVPTVPLTATQSSSGNIAAITGTATRLLTLQSSWFKDNSTNTVTGSNTIISGYQPFIVPTLYSGYGSGLFNGSSDYLTAPASGNLSMGTGDFNWEVWVYPTSSISTNAMLFGYRSGSDTSPFLYYNTSQLFFTGDTTNFLTYNGVPQIGVWTHIAVSRAGTSLKMFINGVAAVTATNSTNFSDASVRYVGAMNGGSFYYFPGYISDLRITKGTAVYTGTFTPPTLAPLTNAGATSAASYPSTTNVNITFASSATSLLTLQNNQAQNNNQFRDSSNSNFTITRSGTPTQGTFTPFSQTGWSGYFNGSSYIATPASVSTSAGWNLMSPSATGTFEAWVYRTSSDITRVLASCMDFGASYTGWFISMTTTGTVKVEGYISGNNVPPAIISTGSAPLNTWTHVAVTCINGAITFYINGTVSGTGTMGATWQVNTSTSTPTWIGNAYTAWNSMFIGYLSNVRMVKGVAVYTGNFTPPTAPLTATQAAGTNIAAITGTATSLLTLQSNRFKDNSTNNFAITASGTPSVQAFSPFAPSAVYSASAVGGSMYFNGSSDYVSIPSTISMGTSDFTWEVWVYPTSSISTNAMIFGYRSGSDTSPYLFYNTSQIIFGGDTTNLLTYTGVPPIGVWTHIAVSRAGTSLKMFINGVAAVTATNSTNFSDASVRYVGAMNGGNFYYFPGYLSNLRIVKGLAVYTSAFTSPTAPLTASVSVTTVSQVGVDFLVVAGGGSGGYCGNGAGGGGGGAGGVRPGASVVMASNVSYTIIVGGGGSSSASGTNSSFHTYTALGGGRGGGWDQASAIASTSGGSGGGAGYGNANAYSASSATAPELGNRGGSGVSAGPYPGGGGGGASAVGGDAPSSSIGGAGGAGYTSAIAGSSSIYGGGGGAGIYGGTAGAGGTGGGGAGVASSGTGFSGTANTGGGGGGSTASGFYGSPGGTGGSGIVIIRYPVDSPAALSTTNANVTIAGGYRIYTWITSGTITFDTFATGVSTTVITPSSLLLSGTNTGIQDATGKNSLTTVGDARISTTVTKYGTGSMYFDGTGDYLKIPSSSLWDFGTGNFTIEFWINTTQTTSNAALIGREWVSSPWTGGWGIQLNGNTSSAMTIYWADYSSSSPFMIANTTSYRDGNWHHIAWVRNGTSFVLYIDGISVATATSSIAFGTVTKNIAIGEDLTFGPRGYLGYIDDLRITKYARYTANFVPPSASLTLR